MTKLLELPPELSQRRQFRGVFSDFTDTPPRQTHNYTAAGLTTGADLATTTIFVPNRTIVLDELIITPNVNATLIDDTNTSTWTFTDGTNTIFTKAYNTNLAFPVANTVTSLGTLGAATLAYTEINPATAAQNRITLAITNVVAATPITQITVAYFDAQAYPSDGVRIIATDDGTAKMTDTSSGALAGLLVMSPGSADNDELYLCSRLELFKIAANKPIVAECRIKYAEANTDDANIMFGLMDAVGANSILDDGGGPKASYSGAIMYKMDGGTTYYGEASVSTTQTPTTQTALSPAVTAGGGVWQTLRLTITTVSSTEAVALFEVDGKEGANIHFTYTSATDMQLILAVKNGGANAETVYVDYFGAWQLR